MIELPAPRRDRERRQSGDHARRDRAEGRAADDPARELRAVPPEGHATAQSHSGRASAQRRLRVPGLRRHRRRSRSAQRSSQLQIADETRHSDEAQGRSDHEEDGFVLRALVCAVCSSLAFAGSAFASFAPKLVVSSGSGGATRIGVSVGLSDDARLPRATIYIPSAYQVGVPAAGTKLGTVTASASAARFSRGVAAAPDGRTWSRSPRPSPRTPPPSSCQRLAHPDLGSPSERARARRSTSRCSSSAQSAGLPRRTAPSSSSACRPDVPAGPGRSRRAKLLSTTFIVVGDHRASDGRRVSMDVALDAVRLRRHDQPNAAGSVEVQWLQPHPDRAQAQRHEDEDHRHAEAQRQASR